MTEDAVSASDWQPVRPLGVRRGPTLMQDLRIVEMETRLPNFALSALNWNDLPIGTLFLALPAGSASAR